MTGPYVAKVNVSVDLTKIKTVLDDMVRPATQKKVQTILDSKKFVDLEGVYLVEKICVGGIDFFQLVEATKHRVANYERMSGPLLEMNAEISSDVVLYRYLLGKKEFDGSIINPHADVISGCDEIPDMSVFYFDVKNDSMASYFGMREKKSLLESISDVFGFGGTPTVKKYSLN